MCSASAFDADPEQQADREQPLDDVAAWIAGAGGLAYLAHTYWRGLRAGEF